MGLQGETLQALGRWQLVPCFWTYTREKNKRELFGSLVMRDLQISSQDAEEQAEEPT